MAIRQKNSNIGYFFDFYEKILFFSMKNLPFLKKK